MQIAQNQAKNAHIHSYNKTLLKIKQQRLEYLLMEKSHRTNLFKNHMNLRNLKKIKAINYSIIIVIIALKMFFKIYLFISLNFLRESEIFFSIPFSVGS